MSVATLIVTIAPGIVASDLPFFPLHIDLSDVPLAFWDLVTADGRDLRASSLTGRELYPIDLQAFDRTGKTGHLFVRVPVAAAGNQFRLDYGDASLIAPEPESELGYLSVWRNFGPVFSAFAPGWWRKQERWFHVQYPTIEQAGDFIYADGGFLRAGRDFPAPIAERSCSWIGKRTQGTADGAAVSLAGDIFDNDVRETLYMRSNGQVGLWNVSDGWLSGGAWTAGRMTQIGFTHNGTISRELYQNGALLATDIGAYEFPIDGNYKYFGAENNQVKQPLISKFKLAYLFRGILSADWYAFEYANWFNPATTISYSVVDFQRFLNMAILFGGTSLADFAIEGATTAITSGVDTYVSEGLEVASGANQGFYLDLPAAETDFWIACYLKVSSGTGTPAMGLAVINTALGPTTPLFSISADQNSTTPKAFYWNGSTSVLFDTGASLASLVRWDIHVKISDTAGVFEVYRDGVLDMDFTSVGVDTKLTSAANIDRVLFRAVGVGQTDYSGIIIADEDTRGLRLVQRLPNAAGAESGWTGAYTAIDETSFNDGDFITAATAGLTSTFGFADLPTEFAASPIAAVILAGRIQGSAVSPTSVQAVARVGGADYARATETPISTAFGPRQAIFASNPATLNEWAVSEINAAEFGVKSIT